MHCLLLYIEYPELLGGWSQTDFIHMQQTQPAIHKVMIWTSDYVIVFNNYVTLISVISSIPMFTMIMQDSESHQISGNGLIYIAQQL